MYNDITKAAEKAREKMQNSCNYYKARIAAWENVKRVYTKNGADFAIVSKCFTGCKFETMKEHYKKYGISGEGYNKVSVWFKDERGIFTEDWITLCDTCYEKAAETADDVEARILALIEKYKMWLAKDERGLAEIDARCKAIIPALETIIAAIKDAETVNAHYTLRDFVKESLR